MRSDFIKTLASDLLTLEINTIVKENFTASKMPSTMRIALLNIADNYRALFVEYGLCRIKTDKEVEDDAERKQYLFRWQFGGEYSFAEILTQAQAGIKRYEAMKEQAMNYRSIKVLEERAKMLFRVQRHASNIVGLFKNRRKEYNVGPDDQKVDKNAFDPQTGLFPPHFDSQTWNNDIGLGDINKVADLGLLPDEITMIRKTWEVGTQKILLQTVVQIDGDVANYLTPQFMELPEELRKIVLGMHNDATESGARVWQMLFNTVAQLAGKAFREIFSRKA